MSGVANIPKTILIVDDDLGFVYWLGHALDAAAYLALPAKSVSDAALLIMQLDLKVDVLLVNTAQIGALEFISALRRSQNNVKVIGILNDCQPAVRVPGLNATHAKPPILDADARNEWLESVQQVLLNNHLYSSIA